jgi:hypothetical protein
MFLIRQKESPVSRICPNRWSNFVRGSTVGGVVRGVAAVAIAIPSARERFTISVVSVATDLSICMSFTRNIGANSVASTSAPISRILRRREVTTLTESFAWLCVLWPKMACPIGRLPGTFGVITEFSSLSPQSKTGSRRLGKKSISRIETDYLDWALANFSGYLAADELYDGPFCVLSAVDARHQRRLLYEVLDHNPTKIDILCFFARLNDQIVARRYAVLGITTDASSLYPQPIALVFRNIPHQICEFHILKEITKAVLHVLARLRKRLAAKTPKLPRGRPKNSLEDQRRRRQAQAITQRVEALFEHRHLFVRHDLTGSQRTILCRLMRYGQQVRALRTIMDEVYRLFDRRCRTDTAIAKLQRLRQRLRRYRSLGKSLDKLHSPNLEKALTFLDEKLLQSTSNVVERANRRHRKMQKTIYRVRTKANLEGRMALDLHRDQQADGRSSTIHCLHCQRG